jgi:L-lactate permease
MLAALVCGGSFASVQFLVSNYVGPQLVDILSSLSAIGSLVLLFSLWHPKDNFVLEGDHKAHTPPKHPAGEVVLAWSPYCLLVVFVLVWGQDAVKAWLNSFTINFPWPGLHNLVERTPPVVAKAAPYGAMYAFSWFSASGTSCLLATICAAVVLRVSPVKFLQLVRATLKQLTLSILTIVSVLGLAFLMNYSGATATLGLAFAATGILFPFFSALLGWLGVFLTGSDTSANALFGNLQVVTANRLGLDPVLMAASNSSGGVMGKMISLQSVAVAAAATQMKPEDEAKLFRFTLRHSILLASLIGCITVLYAYVFKM